jgi:hypothetical protein
MSNFPKSMEPEEDALPFSSTVTFLHAVGQSTLRQGIAVPVIAQIDWIANIRKGQAVPVTIAFGEGQSVTALLRRIDNARGHLQFRYEAKKQAALRKYLADVFGSGKHGVLRVTEVAPQVFAFEPVSIGRKAAAMLSLCNPHFHNCKKSELSKDAEFTELGECLAAIPYSEQSNQSDYNRAISSKLSTMGWQPESRIISEIGLRCDFTKNGYWVEVEFGNARVYYQDYIKFLLALRHRAAKAGILLCPTNAFAQLLCDLGQRRAAMRTGDRAGRQPSYSGMMSHEKAMRELPHLEFILTGSIVVAGIEIARCP